MAWDFVDYTVAGGLVAGAGGAYWIATRAAPDNTFRVAAALALVGAFLLVFINAAVGIIGSSANDANLMYGAVLAIGFFGALLARFRAGGMAMTMLAAAAAQMAIAAIALGLSLGEAGPVWPNDTIAMTGLFTAIWLISAWLFRRSAQTGSDPRPSA